MSEENKNINENVTPEEEVVKEIRNSSMDELESMAEEGNEENRKVLDEAKEKIDEVIVGLNDRIQNMDIDQIKASAMKGKDDIVNILNQAKDKVTEVGQSESFKEKLASGKEFLAGAEEKISSVFKRKEEAPAEEAPVEEAPAEEAPVEEAPAEEAPVDPVVEELRAETMDELDAMAEEGNQDNKKVLDDARNKIDAIFKDLNDRVKDADTDKIKETMGKGKDEVFNVLGKTKDKVVEVSQSENFKETMTAGKNFVVGAGGMLADAFKEAGNTLMKHDKVKGVVEKADEKFDVLRDSEGFKNAVDKAEEITGKVTNTIFGSIKNFLEKEEKPEPEEQVDSDEENNNL